MVIFPLVPDHSSDVVKWSSRGGGDVTDRSSRCDLNFTNNTY